MKAAACAIPVLALAARREVCPLGEREREELITIRRGYGKTAAPERSRT